MGRPSAKLKPFDETKAEKKAVAISASVPKCPRHLNKFCKGVWRELARVLGSYNLLTAADVWVMERFCLAYESFREACAELAKPDAGKVLIGENGGSYQNPWLAIRNKAEEQMAKLSDDLGLDPQARRKMKFEAVEQKQTENKKAKFFKAREGA